MSSRFALISAEDQQLYHCPSFLHSIPPKNIWDVRSTYGYHYGLRMERTSSNPLFSMHFIHFLLLKIFSFVVSLTRVNHFAVWKCGLHFECNLHGIEFLVESSDNLAAITFIMRSKELTVECIRCRSKIVRTVRDSFREYYRNNEDSEFIMDPYHSSRYPLMPRECLTLFNSSQILWSIQIGRRVVESADGISMSVDELLVFEPLLSVGGDCLSALQKAGCTDIVSSDFLTCLAGIISNDKSKLLGDIFSLNDENSVTPQSHRPSLNSSQTYQDIIQRLGSFTSLDSSLLYEESDHSPQYFNLMTSSV